MGEWVQVGWGGTSESGVKWVLFFLLVTRSANYLGPIVDTVVLLESCILPNQNRA